MTKLYLLTSHMKMVDFIRNDIGVVFDETSDNVTAIARHMGWTPSAVRSAIRQLGKRGAMQRTRQGPVRKRWQLMLEAA